MTSPSSVRGQKPTLGYPAISAQMLPFCFQMLRPERLEAKTAPKGRFYPLEISKRFWSGRRDSNPRPQPWQGCALPLSYARIRPERRCGRPEAGILLMAGRGASAVLSGIAAARQACCGGEPPSNRRRVPESASGRLLLGSEAAMYLEKSPQEWCDDRESIHRRRRSEDGGRHQGQFNGHVHGRRG